MTTIRGNRDYAILAEKIAKELEKLEEVEENLSKVDSRVKLTIKNSVGYTVFTFPNITEAAEFIAERMR